jgi:hypothetical protein
MRDSRSFVFRFAAVGCCRTKTLAIRPPREIRRENRLKKHGVEKFQQAKLQLHGFGVLAVAGQFLAAR